MNIILCGLPGSGKTTFGKRVAKKLNLKFIDTDQLIEDTTGMACRKYYQSFGLDQFRQAEQKVLMSLEKTTNSVISLGGGALLSLERVEYIQSLGKVIHLEGDEEEFFLRAISTGTPAYLEQSNPLSSWKKLTEERVPFFKQAAHYTISLDHLTSEQVMESIIKAISYGK